MVTIKFVFKNQRRATGRFDIDLRHSGGDISIQKLRTKVQKFILNKIKKSKDIQKAIKQASNDGAFDGLLDDCVENEDSFEESATEQALEALPRANV